jgi:hypothetical protein
MFLGSKSYATALNLMSLLPHYNCSGETKMNSAGRNKGINKSDNYSVEMPYNKDSKWKEFSRILSIKFEEMKCDLKQLVFDYTNLQNKYKATNKEKCVLEKKVNELTSANIKLNETIRQFTSQSNNTQETTLSNYELLEQSINNEIKIQVLSDTIKAIRQKLNTNVHSHKSIHRLPQVNISTPSAYKLAAEKNFTQSALLADQLISIRSDAGRHERSPKDIPLQMSPYNLKKQQQPYVSNYNASKIKKARRPQL